MAETLPAASPLPRIGEVTVAELSAALKAGIADFRAAPTYGLIFSTVYVLAGIALIVVGAGTLTWTLTLSLGFPLVAPFAAVGLYEVSRRLEAGEPLVAAEIFGVVAAERRRQIPWIGAMLVMIFLFWSFFAHMLFAAFVGPSAMFEPVSPAWLLTPEGATHAAIQIVVGGAVAFFTFSVTVVSLPLLLEKEVDFVSAMLLSMRTVGANLGVMLVWALIIAVILVAAMVPMFLGLFIALPVLGHATWHLYRRALYDPV
ncbi:MAG: DUF2189 domain-containing protein [Paracoccaceae bacterium]|nr:DUF2189 domain-containing protein [Paracoccaceae bacterium]